MQQNAGEMDARNRSEDRPALPPGLQVLIVEDDPLVSQVAVAFLRRLGCATTEAPTAEHALQLLSGESRFDVVMADISLGAGMPGTELAEIVLERFPRTAILLVSGYGADAADGVDATAGMERVGKPYRREDLADALARALASASRRAP
jgi:CheY-like chemotaxis protein